MSKDRSVFPYLPLFSLLPLLLSSCTTHSQTPQLSFSETYPVEEARADLNWTVLERSYPSGRIEYIYLPSSWTPLNLSDYDTVEVDIDRQTDKVTLVIRRK